LSKQASRIEIYSIKQFTEANRLDRIRMHMIEPERFELNNPDWEYYQALQQAFALVYNELRESVAVQAIRSNIAGYDNFATAQNLLRDCLTLYGSFMVKNKDARRAMMLEKLYELAEIAQRKAVEFEDPEWMELAGNLYAKAAAIEGLDKHEQSMPDPDELQIPALEITSDPTAFLESQNDTTDDDEYDDEAEG
jgi:hypothetical protein